MKSSMPKVLHKVGGVPMVEQVLRAVKAAGTQRQVVVVGFGGEACRNIWATGRKLSYRNSSWERAMPSCRQNRCCPAFRARCS